MKTQRTEEIVIKEIQDLYKERSLIWNSEHTQYVGKSYLINGVYYFIDSLSKKRAYNMLVIDENGIESKKDAWGPVEQWGDYEISNEQFIKALEQKVDVFITTIKERE